jgi:hypothetical protein
MLDRHADVLAFRLDCGHAIFGAMVFASLDAVEDIHTGVNLAE